jgi:hypothetical protein
LYVALAADVGQWMADHGVLIEEFDESAIDAYVAQRSTQPDRPHARFILPSTEVHILRVQASMGPRLASRGCSESSSIGFSWASLNETEVHQYFTMVLLMRMLVYPFDFGLGGGD